MTDHSSTCKYIVGNETKNYNKNQGLNPLKKNYKIMKEEVEQKLDEEEWLTAGQVLEWLKSKVHIGKHRSYKQTDEIVQNWRKKNSITKETCIYNHPNTISGSPFLRSFFHMNYKKHNINKTTKVIIWASDFHVNRTKLTNHWHIDGTFTIVPVGFISAMKDPHTGFVKPGIFSLLISKDEEVYYYFFSIVKDIMACSNTNNWK